MKNLRHFTEIIAYDECANQSNGLNTYGSIEKKNTDVTETVGHYKTKKIFKRNNKGTYIN